MELDDSQMSRWAVELPRTFKGNARGREIMRTIEEWLPLQTVDDKPNRNDAHSRMWLSTIWKSMSSARKVAVVLGAVSVVAGVSYGVLIQYKLQ